MSKNIFSKMPIHHFGKAFLSANIRRLSSTELTVLSSDRDCHQRRIERLIGDRKTHFPAQERKVSSFQFCRSGKASSNWNVMEVQNIFFLNEKFHETLACFCPLIKEYNFFFCKFLLLYMYKFIYF